MALDNRNKEPILNASMTGEELKALRKARNMTQSQVAAGIGVTQPAVAGWETGRYTIDKRSEMALRQVLQAPATTAPKRARKLKKAS